jgi:hypothetical protein
VPDGVIPVIIFQTRYGGTYEGGHWAAIYSHPHDFPEEAWGGTRSRLSGGSTTHTKSESASLQTMHSKICAGNPAAENALPRPRWRRPPA